MKNRRAKGLCGYAGCQVVSGDKYHCEPHAKQSAADQKARYWAKREQKARAA